MKAQRGWEGGVWKWSNMWTRYDEEVWGGVGKQEYQME